MKLSAQLGILAVLFLQPLRALADDVITNVMSPVVSYQYLNALDEPGTTTASPMVSYQFPNSLSEAGTPVISPIVSYQYFEWPGDDVLQLLSSPKVSYFYGIFIPGNDVTVRGRVVDALGNPINGATVCASILNVPQVTVQSAPDGRYELPPLAPGIFVLFASQAGQVSDKRVVTMSATLPEQNFRLVPLATLPPLQVANSTPPFLLSTPDELHGAKLMVFDGTGFVPDLGLIDPQKMTVVLTHGWIPCFFSGGIHYWPSNMAHALRAKGLSSAHANIVGWSWETDATGCDVPEQLTPRHGLALGKKLYEVLGSGYRQPLDFMGHSLGALVNRYAVNFLHGQANGKQGFASPAWNSYRTHVSIFDGAEVSQVLHLLAPQSVRLRILLSEGPEGLGWKTPIPISSAWIDNYIADVGFPHSGAVNIDLQEGAGLIDAHSYPQHWYSNSVRSAMPDSFLGFRQSFAYYRMTGAGESEFRAATADYARGTKYHQKPNSSDPLDLEPLPWTDFFDPYFPIVGEQLDRGADYVVGRVESAIRTGEVVIEATEYAAVSAYRGVVSVGSMVANGVSQSTATLRDLLNQPSFRATLRTGLILLPDEGSKTKGAGPVSSNSPAYLWLSIFVPPDAMAMAFDFTISGDGAEDSLAFGINGTNLFSLETKFVADGELSTSRLIDVSAYAGTTNEFFFGILGGTSTNCTVAIEGIRFYTLGLPTLTIRQTNGTTVLSWPSSANGFVLEASPSLSNPAWIAVTNTPTLFDGRFSVTNQWPNETRFFRLRR
jgi:hypothetical protein